MSERQRAQITELFDQVLAELRGEQEFIASEYSFTPGTESRERARIARDIDTYRRRLSVLLGDGGDEPESLMGLDGQMYTVAGPWRVGRIGDE